MGYSHFLYKKEAPELRMETASIGVKVGAVRVIW